ncbi:urea ABC transporter permease subunit UrtB [Pseudosulfitobacter sp. SM2401]|uniref:urea ABC transporter permease subunit UrtB n=1 Tax=Pseudosulfitobacter sp. SM2401 TaxID=3350098 RepID=UPI0036F3AF82
MRRFMSACVLFLCSVVAAPAQDLQPLLQTYSAELAKPSRGSVGEVLNSLATSGVPEVPVFLEQWAQKNIWQRSDGRFVQGAAAGQTLTWSDLETDETGTGDKSSFKQLKPNGGVRRLIATALVQFQLSDPDLIRRQTAVASIARRPDASQLAPLTASIGGEVDPDLKARKTQLANFLTARFADEPADRISAIDSLAGGTSVEARAVLNQILGRTTGVATTTPDGNIARIRDPNANPDAAYLELVAANLAAPLVSPNDMRQTLVAHIVEGRVGGLPLAQLSDPAARIKAYAALVDQGLVPALLSADQRAEILSDHVFFELYKEDDPIITTAAETALASVETRVATAQTIDLTLDALSLASIFFLAAIGLAITFGVMGVINMAHGEFIMMGAYTGYVVQQIIPNYTVSIIVALPVAFAVTFLAGVVMERLVIRWLYNRPLETLLATFGISVALQQLAKNIFGTQARPLTSPEWLAGAWVMNDVIQISYIRIAIFVLALIFLGLILYILKRTRLGLEVRAVTQNSGMAASMGINPDRINMLTFGLGSGIAGIAGVSIGLYAKVTSEMGSDYIVQSFMTVVVGGVGNVWGTLAGAVLIGFGQKGIEWLNPSNTLAAQAYIILFVILFIQFRPKGIVALKGRAAGD